MKPVAFTAEACFYPRQVVSDHVINKQILYFISLLLLYIINSHAFHLASFTGSLGREDCRVEEGFSSQPLRYVINVMLNSKSMECQPFYFYKQKETNNLKMSSGNASSRSVVLITPTYVLKGPAAGIFTTFKSYGDSLQFPRWFFFIAAIL